MDEHDHDSVARWERRWLAAMGLMTLVFVLLIAYTLATEGGHVAQRSGRAAPEILVDSPLFAEPGVRATGPNTFQVTVLAQAFAFDPAEIRLPVGAEVDMFLTARDVIHGYQVQNTTINVELIPGEVAALRYTFDRPGEYRVGCNEYCGIRHQDMLGRIVVLPAAQFAAEAASAGQRGETTSRGEALYHANCASCHQPGGAGLVGAFPPLAGHAAALLRADPDYLPLVLLYGLQGGIDVLGSAYDGPMPAWGGLPDDDLAAILNHIVGLGAGPDAGDALAYDPTAVTAQRGLDLSPRDVYERRPSLGTEE